MDSLYVQLLRNELERRRCKNNQYSLRAFARFLDVDVSHLSKLLRGKSEMTPVVASRISERLALDEKNKEQYLISAALYRTIRYLKSSGVEVDERSLIDRLHQAHSNKPSQ